MAQLAKQVEFDHIVKEVLESGSDWSEAVQEAIETFQESNYDLGALYIYTSKLEFEEKERVEVRCRTVDNVAQGKDTVVNLNFALQGLSQTIKCNNNNSKGTILMCESKKVPLKLIQVLSDLCKEDEEEENSNGEEDSDEDDKEEDLIMQKVTILNFLLFFLSQPVTSFRRFDELLVLDENLAQAMLRIIDGSSDHPKPLEQFLDVVAMIVRIPMNKDFLSLSGIVQVLDLAKKMNKNNVNIATKVDALLSQF